MSEILDKLADSWDQRMAVRRRMLTHLGIDIEDMTVCIDPADIRATLCACAHCRRPEVCEGWIAQDAPGLPAFCGARTSFQNLATAAERAQAGVA